ncbi:hypothetical protein Hanom_Chr10g00960401 [Helianthus anomalus]
MIVHGRAFIEIRMPDYPGNNEIHDGHLVVVGKFPKVVLEGPLNPNALTVEGILHWLEGGEEGFYPPTILMGERTGVFSLNRRHQLLLLLVRNMSPPFPSLVSYINPDY